jgi:isochorismate synthase
MPALIPLLQEQLARKLPFVAYRKPGEELLTALLQEDRKIHYVQDYKESGFVFAPFNQTHPKILLPPDKDYMMRYPAEPELNFAGWKAPVESETEHTNYLKLVGEARNFITKGGCLKVVVSRMAEVRAGNSPLDTFESLLKMYPTAFCYLWYHPKIGTWGGASPEMLLKLEDGIFSTMSLAGSMAYTGNPDPQWGQKELEEQALVTHFIKDTLKPNVASLHIADPVTVRAGEILHLQSRISGKAGGCGLAALIGSLHPTPAVCGLPRNAAMDFIRRNEDYDRAFYTGFLGEINMRGGPAGAGGEQANLYVNLRCMSFSGRKAYIYVGGGITRASAPEAEWQETQYKTGTMLRALFNSAE